MVYWLDGPPLYALVSDGEPELRAMPRSICASTATGGRWRSLQRATTQP